MNLFRTLGGMALVGLAGSLGLSGCINKPDYSNTPEIEFKSARVVRVLASNGGLELDSLVFAIDFKDGDGDLGLDDADLKMAPFNETTGGPNNKGKGLNYLIQPYKKGGTATNPTYTLFIVPGGTLGEYDGRYPRLNGADGRAAPLTGTLRYKLPVIIDGNAAFPGIFNVGDVFRFEISILDRNLHESNKITTSEVTLGR